MESQFAESYSMYDFCMHSRNSYISCLFLLVDFFVGIGDINSTFLPKVEPLTVSTPPSPSTVEASSSVPTETGFTPEEIEQSEAEKKTMLSKNSETLNAQVQERPLAKMQEELKQFTAADGSLSKTETISSDKPGVEEKQPKEVENGNENEQDCKTDQKKKSEDKMDSHDTDSKQLTKPEKAPPRKALLENNDTELIRVNEVQFQTSFFQLYPNRDDLCQILSEIHYKFYNAYDAHSKKPGEPPQKRKSGSSKSNKPLYDVTVGPINIGYLYVLIFVRSESSPKFAPTY